MGLRRNGRKCKYRVKAQKYSSGVRHGRGGRRAIRDAPHYGVARSDPAYRMVGDGVKIEAIVYTDRETGLSRHFTPSQWRKFLHPHSVQASFPEAG